MINRKTILQPRISPSDTSVFAQKRRRKKKPLWTKTPSGWLEWNFFEQYHIIGLEIKGLQAPYFSDQFYPNNYTFFT